MDELSSFLEPKQSSRGRPKRISCPDPILSTNRRRGRPRKLSMSSLDEGIGSSLDPLNDSIAQSVKRHKRVTNSKQFDSDFFLNSVVKQIESKYKNPTKDDAIIDLQNLEIIDKKGFVEQRVRTEFGYFAENTLEDLRQNSFRNKELISYPLIAPIDSPVRRPSKTREQSVITGSKASKKQIQSKTSTSRALQLRNATQLSVQPIKHPKTAIMIASDEDSDEDMIVDNRDSDEESNNSNQSEELDENHPLMKFENRNLWADREYQIVCFKKTIEMLKNDRSGRFKNALKQRAQETINLPALPTGSNVHPIIKFNCKGEPNFEFHFLSKDSPLEARDELNVDYDIICFSKTIYDCITLTQKPRGRPKRLSYNRRQLEFN